MSKSSSRRIFLKKLALSGSAVAAVSAANATDKTAAAGLTPLPRRKLGKTGADVSILGLGLGSVFTKAFGGDPEATEQVLRRALAHGVNYWDTARAYGISEEIIGPVLEQVRDKVFIVSKSSTRTYDGFMRDLETSLKNLRTDHLNLYHLHNLNPEKDPDLKLIENGAVKAARKAQEEGIIGNYGVTGHSGIKILSHAVEHWEPQALLSVFPVDRPDDGEYEDKLLPLAHAKGMGVIAMKTVRWARNSDLPGPQLIRYAMSLKGISTAIVGLDSLAHLDENAAMARQFEPMSASLRSEMTDFVRAEIASLGPAPWERHGYEDGVLS